jgi:hypothetical protein
VRIVTESGLPAPSLIIHSGGGIYPLWRLTRGEDLTIDPMAATLAATTSERLQHLLGLSAAILGYHYGTGVGDLARVLRIPGTVNGKVPDTPRPCRILPDTATGQTFDLMDLSTIIEDNIQRLEPQLPAPPPESVPRATPARAANGTWAAATPVRVINGTGDSPFDRFEQNTDWATILEPFGWRLHHVDQDGTRHWTRPGKELRDGPSATTGRDGSRDRMWCFSDAAGLPVNESMTKAFVYANLNHGGDMKAAATALADLGFGERHHQDAKHPALPARAPAPASTRHGTIDAADLCLTPDEDAQGPASLGGELPWLPPAIISPNQEPCDFPVDALPPTMAAMVGGVAEQLQMAPDLPALAALSTVASVAASRYQVSRPRSGWSQFLNLYSISAMLPGERKTDAMRLMTDPLWQIERDAQARSIERCEQQIDELDLQRGASGASASALNRVEDAITKLKEQIADPPLLVLPADSTPEALTRRLGIAGHGCMIDDEASPIDHMLGQYGKTPNITVYLKAYDGERYRVDRIGRPASNCHRPLLTMGFATQPAKLERFIGSEALTDRGLPARFIACRPRSRVGRRTLDVIPLSRGTKRAWQEVIEQIARAPEFESTTPVDDIPMIVMSPEADLVFVSSWYDIERRLQVGEEYGTIGLWASKQAGRILRIAALLHLAAGFTHAQEISEHTMRCSVAISNWAIAHMKQLTHTLQREEEIEGTDDQCRTVIATLRRKGIKEFTRRELTHKLVRTAWMTKDRVSDILDRLMELGWLRTGIYLDRAGRQRTKYLVCPMDPDGTFAFQPEPGPAPEPQPCGHRSTSGYDDAVQPPGQEGTSWLPSPNTPGSPGPEKTSPPDPSPPRSRPTTPTSANSFPSTPPVVPSPSPSPTSPTDRSDSSPSVSRRRPVPSSPLMDSGHKPSTGPLAPSSPFPARPDCSPPTGPDTGPPWRPEAPSTD